MLQVDSDCLPSALANWEATSVSWHSRRWIDWTLFSLCSRTIRWIFLSVQADLHIVCSSVRFLFVTFILTKRLAKTRFSAIIPPPFPSFSPPVSPRLRSSPCANCPGVPTASLSLFSPLLHMFYEPALWQCSSRSFNSYNVTVKRKMEIEMGFVALWIEPFLSQSRSKDWIICTLL